MFYSTSLSILHAIKNVMICQTGATKLYDKLLTVLASSLLANPILPGLFWISCASCGEGGGGGDPKVPPPSRRE